MDLSGVKRECSDGVSDVQPLQSKRICVQNENGKLFYVQIEKKPSGETTLDLVPHQRIRRRFLTTAIPLLHMGHWNNLRFAEFLNRSISRIRIR